jgi:hypothetical protein
MARSPRTQAELHADSRTLLYEFDMLCGTAAQLAGIDRTRQRIAYNSTVESFALHCRGLIAFFFDHNPRYDTDAVAADFFSVPDYWASLHNLSQFLADAQNQAHKQIAHMTTVRRNLNASGGKDGIWQISDIVQEICKLVAEFLATAPDQNFDPDTKQKLAELVRQNTRPVVPPPMTHGAQANAPTSTQGQNQQQLTNVRTIGISMTGKTCP